MNGARVLDARASRAPGRLGAGLLFASVLLATLSSARPAWCLWQTFGLADGLVSLQVRGIVEDRSENLWFATDKGVSRYDGATFRTFTQADGLVNDDVGAIYA